MTFYTTANNNSNLLYMQYTSLPVSWITQRMYDPLVKLGMSLMNLRNGRTNSKSKCQASEAKWTKVLQICWWQTGPRKQLTKHLNRIIKQDDKSLDLWAEHTSHLPIHFNLFLNNKQPAHCTSIIPVHGWSQSISLCPMLKFNKSKVTFPYSERTEKHKTFNSFQESQKKDKYKYKKRAQTIKPKTKSYTRKNLHKVITLSSLLAEKK